MIIVLLFYKYNPIARDSSTCDNEERTNSLLVYSAERPCSRSATTHPSPQTPPGIGADKEPENAKKHYKGIKHSHELFNLCLLSPCKRFQQHLLKTQVGSTVGSKEEN